MMSKKIMTDMGEIELLEFVPDFYIHISEKANKILSILRKGLSTWGSEDTLKKMNVSLWVYNAINVNAFAQYSDSANYIALSVGLLQKFWDAANEFVYHPNFHKVIHLADEKKSDYVNKVFFLMVNFIVAHEFGHIAHGHLLYDKQAHSILNEYMDKSTKRTTAENGIIQMKEFDADNFAADVNFILCIQDVINNPNKKSWFANFDMLFITTYLTFRTLAANSNRDFSSYFEHDIDYYDHPHPGIRMFYSYFFYADWICSNNYDVSLVYSGIDAVIAYDKQVLDTKNYRDCFYSIAQTRRGADHVKFLANGWRKLVSKYNRYAYVHISRKEFIDEIYFSLDENGNFLKL